MTLKQIGTFFYFGGTFGGMAGTLIYYVFTDTFTYKPFAFGLAITLITALIAITVKEGEDDDSSIRCKNN